MYDNPVKLQDTCISYICDNVEAVCEVLEDPADPLAKVCTFKRDGDVFLHNRIAEQLLEKWSETGKLTDSILNLFTRHRSHLRKVVIKNSPQLSYHGLNILKEHNILFLTVEDLRRLTVEDLVKCLNAWTLRNLYELGVTRSSFAGVDQSQFPFETFANLRLLNVSHTEFNEDGLENCAKNLPHLESLDLSITEVTDLSSLCHLRHSLKSLSLYKLSFCSEQDPFPVLHDLEHLQVLDISDDPNERHLFSVSFDSSVRRILRRPEVWPNLVSLDVSGRPLETAENDKFKTEESSSLDMRELLRQFVSSHSKLSFFGLALTEASNFPLFTDEKAAGYDPQLRVTGEATEKQVLLSLAYYVSRSYYMQKTLYYLFHLTQGLPDPRHDVITLLFPIMKRHKSLPVQLAATACLYNLIRQELSTKLHPSCLSKVVDVTLDAMETHPRHQQLQKNTLLTLCSDKILQEIEFDRYRCARLVLECLCQFDDASMNRMCVAICGILAAKISTEETSLLGSKPEYMAKLLQIVDQKLQAGEVDVTLKFTLSALWNLTDESPSTCEMFLQAGGLDLFVGLLNTERFLNEASIETKVLGLLNNLAEVGHLRSQILRSDFISVLSFRLLSSEHIDVSYFAAGILSHLCSSEEWQVEDSVPRQNVLDELEKRVISWDNPTGEMVAYRSFRPFFKLLQCSMKEVQLWAIWAIRHVCTKNPQRYCPMLKEEGGDVILKAMTRKAVEPLASRLSEVLSILDHAEKREELIVEDLE